MKNAALQFLQAGAQGYDAIVVIWLAFGISLVSLIGTGARFVANKADGKETREGMAALKRCIEERVKSTDCAQAKIERRDAERELWKAVNANRDYAANTEREVIALKGSVDAYNEQMRELVCKLIEVITNGSKV